MAGVGVSEVRSPARKQQPRCAEEAIGPPRESLGSFAWRRCRLSVVACLTAAWRLLGSRLRPCSEPAAAAQGQRPAVGVDQGAVQRPGPPGRPGLDPARVVGGGAAGWAGPAPTRLVPGVEGGGGLAPRLETLDRVDQV